jgi:glycosyltransferase involved in cell wall biosynthesis
MAHARGKYLVTMDGDLQNDPRDIPMLVDTLEESYDLVAGWRMKREDTLVTCKIPSRVANWLIGKITGIPIRDNGCSLKAYRASVIRHVPLYSEMHRFIPAMSSIAGARIIEVPVRHHARKLLAAGYRPSFTYVIDGERAEARATLADLARDADGACVIQLSRRFGETAAGSRHGAPSSAL